MRPQRPPGLRSQAPKSRSNGGKIEGRWWSADQTARTRAPFGAAASPPPPPRTVLRFRGAEF